MCMFTLFIRFGKEIRLRERYTFKKYLNDFDIMIFFFFCFITQRADNSVFYNYFRAKDVKKVLYSLCTLFSVSQSYRISQLLLANSYYW